MNPGHYEKNCRKCCNNENANTVPPFLRFSHFHVPRFRCGTTTGLWSARHHPKREIIKSTGDVRLLGVLHRKGVKNVHDFPRDILLQHKKKNRSVFTGSGCGGITCLSYHVNFNPIQSCTRRSVQVCHCKIIEPVQETDRHNELTGYFSRGGDENRLSFHKDCGRPGVVQDDGCCPSWHKSGSCNGEQLDKF